MRSNDGQTTLLLERLEQHDSASSPAKAARSGIDNDQHLGTAGSSPTTGSASSVGKAPHSTLRGSSVALEGISSPVGPVLSEAGDKSKAGSGLRASSNYTSPKT